MCRRDKVAPIPSDAAFPSPALMSPSTQNAPSVEQVRLRRLVARRGGRGEFPSNCVPGTRGHSDACADPKTEPQNPPPRNLGCAPREKRTNRAAHTTTHTPQIGSACLLSRQLADALEVLGEDGSARRPCIQKNTDNRALGLY